MKYNFRRDGREALGLEVVARGESWKDFGPARDLVGMREKMGLLVMEYGQEGYR